MAKKLKSVPKLQPDVEVAIIGTGFSGLGAAIRLKQEGFDDFVVLERNANVGGTWYNNHYPGCACDVQSHLYSFSFEPNPNWSRMFANQPEILAYLERCADRHKLQAKTRFNTWVTGAFWDEARAFWRIRTHSADQVEAQARAQGCHAYELDFSDPGMPAGEEFTARFLISGMGGLSRPAYPDIPGLKNFQGELFHSADWNHDYDVTGKRVAVIGTGASAIQFVPQIAGKVAKLDLYQRTPPWIMPKPDRAVPKAEQELYRLLPKFQEAQRARLYWQLESRALAFVISPRLMVIAEREARSHLRRQVPDKTLRRKLTPDYTIGCKRILISDDYYPALCRDNVSVITDGVREVRGRRVIDGQGFEREVDAIILGTGFQPQAPIPRGVVIGRNQRDLYDTWQGGLVSYLGTTVHGYPNLFLLMGPNTGLGHNSMVYMIESQIQYLIDCLKQVRKKQLKWIDVREQIQAGFCEEVQNKSGNTVWSSGCRSWYLNENGKNTTLWPGFTWDFRNRTRRFHLADYHYESTAEDPLYSLKTA